MIAGGRELVESLLPHRESMLLVDAITGFRPGVRAVLTASLTVTGQEVCLRGHFPGRPIWPGVLLIEGLAQCAGLVIHLAAAHGRGEMEARGEARLGMLAGANVKFLQVVEPPAQIDYQVRIIGVFGGLYRVDGEAAVAGRAVADGSVSIALGLS